MFKQKIILQMILILVYVVAFYAGGLVAAMSASELKYSRKYIIIFMKGVFSISIWLIIQSFFPSIQSWILLLGSAIMFIILIWLQYKKFHFDSFDSTGKRSLSAKNPDELELRNWIIVSIFLGAIFLLIMNLIVIQIVTILFFLTGVLAYEINLLGKLKKNKLHKSNFKNMNSYALSILLTLIFVLIINNLMFFVL